MTEYELKALFEQAKQRLDIKEVAQRYGLQINRAGFVCCPFHNEKTPSMKINDKEQYFKCFGCGAGGDVFKLVGELMGISKPIDVLKMLNNDYCLGLDFDSRQTFSQVQKAKQKQAEYERKKGLQQAFDEWVHNAFITCTTYAKLLREWHTAYAPKEECDLENIHPLFEESLLNLTRTEYLCECLTYGDRSEQEQFYKLCRNEVRAIAERLDRYNRQRAG